MKVKNLIMVFVSFIFVSFASAEEIKIDDIYEIFISKTRNISFDNGVKNSNEVFFGKYNDYMNQKSEELKTLGQGVGSGATAGLGSAANGASNSALNATGKAVGQNLGVGVGIGLVVGLVDVVYKASTEDERYILVKDYENVKGEKTRVSALIVCNSEKNETLIKSFLLQEIEKKYYLKKD